MVHVHDKSIKDMDYAEYGLEAKSQGGLLARLHVTRAFPTYNIKSLTHTQIALYNDTWCCNSMLGRIDDTEFVFIPMCAEEPIDTQPLPRPP